MTTTDPNIFQRFQEWLMWDWPSIIGMVGMLIAFVCFIVMMCHGVRFSLFGTIATRSIDDDD